MASGLHRRKSTMHRPPARDSCPPDGMRQGRWRLAKEGSAQEGLEARCQSAPCRPGLGTGIGLSLASTPSAALAMPPLGVLAEPSAVGPASPGTASLPGASKLVGTLRPGLQGHTLAAGHTGEGSASEPRPRAE
uniref:Uncharacterized protein n=1 Tax=Sphaerodactylus townsendi TaxID=933632 RepID=A0ACB8G254_9SAUR